MTSPSEQFTGRERVVILHDKQKLSDLDLWPGDEVWNDQYQTIGRVTDKGEYVATDVGRKP